MPNVPEAPTIRDEVTASSKWNEFRDAIRFLMEPPIANLRQNSVQSLANATLVAIQLNAFDVDSDVDGTGGHDTVTNNTRFTARYPGWHWVSGGVGFATNGNNWRAAELAVNGVPVNGSGVQVSAASTTAPTMVPARGGNLVYLDAGHFVEIYGWQNSGGALNTAVSGVQQPSMTIRWVSI